ncbi:SRPBCC domain-containing protein [Amycolatopsis sp. CA-230715]|uniref:SRPBCC domain-containing protein n=1 Tax=Amycolatopsis sp. CA-230715 TaxID=2745196 RepID=UPI001C01A815|nr:SRPBCC domain-containing protein [Amycolatopsis sp. CA-230715]
MTVPDRIERQIELAHRPEAVWAALTTAEGLGGWFGSEADVDLRPGGEAHVRWGDEHSATLWIQVVEPPSRFAYTWAIYGLPESDPRRTYVEFTLVPDGDGTRLTVVETGFAQLPDELKATYDGNVSGWRKELGELVDYLDAA